MMTRQYSSRAFNHDVAGAKRASRDGPVIVTDRGVPAHVLLSWDEYRRLQGKRETVADLLNYPGLEDVDLDALIGPRTTEPFRDPFAEK